MPFQVSCPTCESRLKLPDRLYETRVRGRLAPLHCTRCKTAFQIDGRAQPEGNKLPSVPPAADVAAPSSAPETTSPSAAAPSPSQTADPAEAPAPTSVAEPPERRSGSPAPDRCAPRLDGAPPTALHDPSPAELKSLFSGDDAWERPSAPPPSPPAAPEREARARAERAAFRASRPPKPARTRSAAPPRPAVASASPYKPDCGTAESPRPKARAPSVETVPPAAPGAQPSTPRAPSREAAPQSSGIEPRPADAAAAKPPVSAYTHTDLSAFLASDAPFTPTAAVTSAPPPRFGSRPSVRWVVAAVLGVGVLAGGVWLSARSTDHDVARLQAGATPPAQPLMALVSSPLERARAEAEAVRREAAASREAAVEVPPTSQPARTRRRARRASRAKARVAARSVKTPATERTRPRPFDIARANRALSAAAGRARFCGHGSTLPTTVQATVTFDPSGRVRVVRVTPSASRSRTAACVASAMRGIRVPAFRGNPVIVSRRIAVTGAARASR